MTILVGNIKIECVKHIQSKKIISHNRVSEVIIIETDLGQFLKIPKGIKNIKIIDIL